MPDTQVAQTAFAELVRPDELDGFIARARREDLGAVGDVTTDSIVEQDRTATAAVVPRKAGVVAGMPVAAALADAYEVDFEIATGDGEQCRAYEAIATISGPLRDVLGVERPLLNTLGWMCGIATLTATYVNTVRGSRAVICDTRKTTPGLRGFEKYAVLCGGGHLHRSGLFDAALYKDNHLAHVPLESWTETLSDAIRAARDAATLRFVEVEVDTLAQLDAVLDIEAGLVDIVLLDNMSTEHLRQAVRRRDQFRSDVQLEASGGVSLNTVAAIAATGVDRISVGGLTHSVTSLDIGLDIA